MKSQGDFGAGSLDRALRKLDWTGVELARRCGVNVNTVSKWRKGKLMVPRYAVEIVRLALQLQASGSLARKDG